MSSIAEAVETHFDLRGLVREELASAGTKSPREVAEAVLDRIPEAFYRAALATTLTEYVRDVNRRATETDRVQSLNKAVSEPGQHVSKKVAGIGHMWTQVLARRIPTPKGEYVGLADANAEQVRFYAGLLNIQARRTQDAASAYEELADLMGQHNAGRVRDLPVHVGGPLAQKIADA